LSLDSDGFAIIQDIITVLASYVSFAGTKLVTTLASDELKKIVPGIDLMSPRTRCEKIVKHFSKELAAKNMKAISVFKMADPNNTGSVTCVNLESSFKKIFPAMKLEIIQELMEAFKANRSSEIIKKEDFEAVFKDDMVVGTTTVIT
jgi:Ca2+-binding EF-hand superfamily protein